MRHSALPFQILSEPGNDVVNIADADGKRFCEVDSTYTGCAKANADFIAQACNSHDELVAACEANEQCIADFIELYKRGCSNTVMDEAVKSLRGDALKRTRAALAKAEGESA